MGSVKIDLGAKAKRMEDTYPLNIACGVYALLANIHQVKEIRINRGDYDACNILLDLFNSMEKANLTARQREVLYHFFIRDMNQQEVAVLLNITQQTVSDHVTTAVNKIAQVNERGLVLNEYV